MASLISVVTGRTPSIRSAAGAGRAVLQLAWMPAALLPLASNAAPLLKIAATALLLALGWLVCLATADANLGLLGKGPPKKDAFLGKVVLVVGASQGLGAALARQLAQQGARLILSSRSVAALQGVKQSCEGAHASEAVVLPMDVLADNAQLAATAEQADAAFGGVDFVFLVAGASQSALAEETTAEVAEEMLRLNTLGSINIAQALLPAMLRRHRGRFVVVSSMAARVPSPGQAMYAATKAALSAYFASLAAEVADRGVSVTLVCPGPINADPGASPRSVSGASARSSQPSQPRSVYGASGRISQPAQPRSSKKVDMQRCTQLICAAAAHGVAEAWIARHPVLLAGYVMHYLPALGWPILKKLGPKRARALKSGKSGYEYDLVTGKDK